MIVTLTELRGEESRALALRTGEERLRLALAGTDTGFWEWDVAADGLFWTDGVGPLFGLGPGVTPDGFADFIALVHPDDRERIETEARAGLADGDYFMLEFRTRHPDGSERWIASRARGVPDDAGRPGKLIGVAGDVTERRRREDALAFLDEAGKALAASVDPVQTLNDVAHLAVPRLADWCAVQLASGSEGEFEQIAVAHVDPEKVRWARRLQERYPPDQDAPTGVPEVIRTGRSELYPEIDEELLRRSARDEEHLEIIRQVQIRSAMIVPLRAMRPHAGRDHVHLRRVGPPVLHARARARRGARPPRRHRARPRAPVRARAPDRRDAPARAAAPHPARRSPATSSPRDTCRARSATTSAATGTTRSPCPTAVTGSRSATSAAAGCPPPRSWARSATRYAPTRSSAGGPAAALTALRALTDRLEALAFATIAYVVYDPRSGEARMASAGHLPALIREDDGTTRFVPHQASPPLGADTGLAFQEATFALAPGATLVLYTDGLVESREHTLDVGLDRIAAAAAASTGDVQRLADDVVAGLPEAQRPDDVAVLALRRCA